MRQARTRISDREYAALERAATTHGISKAEVLRRALRTVLASMEARADVLGNQTANKEQVL